MHNSLHTKQPPALETVLFSRVVAEPGVGTHTVAPNIGFGSSLSHAQGPLFTYWQQGRAKNV